MDMGWAVCALLMLSYLSFADRARCEATGKLTAFGTPSTSLIELQVCTRVFWKKSGAWRLREAVEGCLVVILNCLAEECLFMTPEVAVACSVICDLTVIIYRRFCKYDN